MATSTWRQIGPVLELLEDVAIAGMASDPHRLRVLDVGCGWGRYGALIKDSWPWAQVVGLDPRPKNVRWAAAYDAVWLGVLPHQTPLHLGRFDVVLLLDVIEHLAKERGADALTWCRRRGPTILATPNGFMPQDGGRYDEHLSGWTVEDLEALGARVVMVIPSRRRHPAADGPGQLIAYFEAL